MALVIPKKFPSNNDCDSWAEEETLDAFSSLEDKWVVLYPWDWQSVSVGKQDVSEADFVLLHQGNEGASSPRDKSG